VLSRRTAFLVVILIAAAVLVGRSRVRWQDSASTGPKSIDGDVPTLINTCLITRNVQGLVEFYRQVLGTKPRTVNDQYAEFSTGVGVLAIFSADAQEKYIPRSAEPASNKSAILEFRVADVDREYSRLQPIVKTWVKPPTTQPWGTRSIYFRDPDGNLVDFFTPTKR
jgi:catechol 2,3-dioxygenase-like lactoylglutathione lyase family enzyme